MQQSLKEMTLVPQELLQERFETVKELENNETEGYEIVKDTVSGEHYIHYAYGNLSFLPNENIMEQFHYLMPLEHDDVISVIFSEMEYRYPDNWHGTFLRNGPIGFYVWFDAEGTKEQEDMEKLGEDIKQKLLSFKEKRNFDKDSVEQFLEELERIKEQEE